MVKEWIIGGLKTRGYKKQGWNFVKDLGDTLCLAQVYRSRFGPEYFLEVGVVFKEFQIDDITCSLFWHLNNRIEHLFSSRESLRDVKRALDEDKDMDELERLSILETALELGVRTIEGQWSDRKWAFAQAKLPPNDRVAIPQSFRNQLLERNL